MRELARLRVSVCVAGFSKADISRSLLYTVSNDIGQIASLYAMLHKLDKVGGRWRLSDSCHSM